MSSFRLSIYIVLPLALGLSLLTGACGVPVAVSAVSYAADGGFMVASDKTSTDHLASVITKKDCAMWRIFRGRRICTERAEGEDPYDIDYNEPQRQVSEDGVQYSPPLRSSADAPAASWDEAAYKAAPQPAPSAAEAPAMVQEPVAAAAPAPVVAKATAAPAKPIKKTKSVSRPLKKQKPSRGQAAPAS
ncbi:hypothetical protein [Reyranella sp.]|uniref:hypothetical protein n=1 Tax=Reyranella sp. TaxID=1929291 RepID=UPI00121EC50F|nr:hypothetical protein [Reyranella sp.]TAJ89358.1 MAG: hypothetical protein EPO50_03035 [Reyranella sp.]